MTDDFDIGAPTLLVNVYEAGRLLTRVPCESADAHVRRRETPSAEGAQLPSAQAARRPARLQNADA